ncbi:MAG: hypothetical protein ACP5T9_03640, partial [Thermoplasmata archaeon]
MKPLVLALIFILLVSSISILPQPNTNQGVQAPQKVVPFSEPIIYINSTFVINEFTIDPLTGLKGEYGVGNPIVITATGHLIVENATLYFLSSIYNNLYIDIQGGNLTIINGALTVAPDMLGPDLVMTLNMTSGSVYMVNSKAMFSGSILVTGGTFKAINTLISGASIDEVQEAIDFGMNSTYAQGMQYDPSMNFSNAVVFFNGARVTPLYSDMISNEIPIIQGYESYGFSIPALTTPMVFTNVFTPNSTFPYFTLVNAIRFVIYYKNMGNYMPNATSVSFLLRTPTGNYVFNTTPYIYLPYVLPNQTGMVNYTIYLSNITPIVPPFLLSYYLQNAIQTWFKSTAPANSIYLINETAYFELPKNVYSHMSQHVLLMNSTTAYIMNSYIGINYNINVDGYDTLYATSGTNIYWYNTSIESSPVIVSMPFMVDSSSNIYIYRNAVLNARNFDNTTVDNIAVAVRPYDLFTGGYNVNGLNSIIWSKTSFNRFSTNAQGIAVIPLLSDVVNYNYMPNSLYLGNYNITFVNPVGGYLKNITVSLMHFPLLQPVDNNYMFTIKFNIPDFQLVSLSVPKPLIVGHTYDIVATVIVYGGPASDSTSVLFTFTGGSVNITLGQVA